MTTELKRPVSRRCLIPHRGRRLVATLAPGDLLILRHERTRREEVISIAGVYDYAVKNRVARELWEKRQARKGRRT
jgi:hypothetical protein